MATTTWNSITVPAGTDLYNLAPDLLTLAESATVIVPVANTTARAAAAAATTPSATNPLYVHRADAATGAELEVSEDGTNWGSIIAGPVTGQWKGATNFATGSGAWGPGTLSAVSGTNAPCTISNQTLVVGAAGVYAVTYRSKFSAALENGSTLYVKVGSTEWAALASGVTTVAVTFVESLAAGAVLAPGNYRPSGGSITQNAVITVTRVA